MWEYKTEYVVHPGFPGTDGWYSTSRAAHAWVAEQSDPEEWRVLKRKVSPWTVDRED